MKTLLFGLLLVATGASAQEVDVEFSNTSNFALDARGTARVSRSADGLRIVFTNLELHSSKRSEQVCGFQVQLSSRLPTGEWAVHASSATLAVEIPVSGDATVRANPRHTFAISLPAVVDPGMIDVNKAWLSLRTNLVAGGECRNWVYSHGKPGLLAGVLYPAAVTAPRPAAPPPRKPAQPPVAPADNTLEGLAGEEKTKFSNAHAFIDTVINRGTTRIDTVDHAQLRARIVAVETRQCTTSLLTEGRQKYRIDWSKISDVWHYLTELHINGRTEMADEVYRSVVLRADSLEMVERLEKAMQFVRSKCDRSKDLGY